MSLTALTAAVLTTAVSVAYTWWATPRWAERGIRTGRLPRAGVAAAQILTTVAVAAAVHAAGGPAVNGSLQHAAVWAGVGAWVPLAVLAAVTDWATAKVPRDACLTGSALGLVATVPVLAAAPALWLPFLLTATGLVGVPWAARAVTGKGLGFGDIRLLTAAAFTVGWWVATPWLLWALIGAALTQFVIRLLLPARTRARFAALTARPADEHARTRTGLPFAPALTVWITAAVVAAPTLGSTCAVFPGAC